MGKFQKDRLIGKEWHKYVIHSLRNGANTEKRIRTARAWLEDNIKAGEWMVSVMDNSNCALFYIVDDADAMLFEIGFIFHALDKRGKKIWV
jgi:hypothetical protein